MVRSRGRKVQVSRKHEVSTLLRNLGWADMQQSNYITVEEMYRYQNQSTNALIISCIYFLQISSNLRLISLCECMKALSIELDSNKMCNLATCLIHQGRVVEANPILERVNPNSSRPHYEWSRF